MTERDSNNERSPNETTVAVSPKLLKGRYLLGRRLGQGGFGTVYLGADQALHGRPVVVKLLTNTAAGQWSVAKFGDELRALAKLNHPGIVMPLDHGRTGDGQLFIVIEYVNGVSLDQAIPRDGMPRERAANVLRQIASALGEAHRHGVWHRDLKPANVMLEANQDGDRVRLIDFGLSTIADPAESGQVQTRVAGSLPYMAPEQLQGRVSAATDVFAFGVVAYETLTGRKPFVADDAFSLLQQQRAGVKLKPSSLRPDVPPRAEAVILNALAFELAKRPADIRDVGEQLYRALTIADADAVTAQLPKPRSSFMPYSVGAVVLAIAIAAALVWPRKTEPPSNSPRSPPQTAPIASFSFSLLVQPLRDGRPSDRPVTAEIGKPIAVSDGVVFVIRSSDAGHLYLFGESTDGELHVLFPAPHMYGGSSSLAAGGIKHIPERSWFQFDSNEKQRVWFVWAEQPVQLLEATTKWVNAEDRGVVKEAAERARIHLFLTQTVQDDVPVRTATEEIRRLQKSPNVWTYDIQTTPQ